MEPGGLDVGRLMFDIRCWMLVVRCWILNPELVYAELVEASIFNVRQVDLIEQNSSDDSRLEDTEVLTLQKPHEVVGCFFAA